MLSPARSIARAHGRQCTWLANHHHHHVHLRHQEFLPAYVSLAPKEKEGYAETEREGGTENEKGKENHKRMEWVYGKVARSIELMSHGEQCSSV